MSDDWDSGDVVSVEDNCSRDAFNAVVDSVTGGGVDVAVVERWRRECADIVHLLQ